MDFIDTSTPSTLPINQHALHVLSSDDPDKAPIKYLNEALSSEQLTVYVPVDTDNATDNNTERVSKLASEIANYDDHLNHGNLLTLDIRSFYNSVLAGNVQPFEELKILLEEALKERIASGKSDEVTFVSGIAGTLATNQKFDQCINSEMWWQMTHSEWLQKGLKVTLICSHPRKIFDKNHFVHYRQAMSSLHNAIV